MYVLAVDIGASSGRHILGSIENGKIVLEEMYRFPNGFEEKDGLLVWDTEKIFFHILEGMKKCKEAGKIPVSVGVDTWGVDFALIDKQGKLTAPVVAYRDSRTEKYLYLIPESTLYSLTGNPMQPYNSIYQLMATPKEWLQRADRCLFVPDYFHFLLSGKMANEYTESSTSGLLSAKTRSWDPRVLELAGIPEKLFPENPVFPGTILGSLTPKVQKEAGFNCQVILPASHDTGSAYISVPARDENAVFISSGTWSLLGIETDTAVTSDTARLAGFTNEGSYSGGICLLRNIMGLWMLQCIRHENQDRYSFAQMADMAKNACYDETVDVGDNRFLSPQSMTEEVLKVLKEKGAPLPKDLPQLLRCVNLSLAKCYQQAILDLSRMTGKTFTSVNIVGGGSKNEFLNQCTADFTNLPVYAGPDEGTALGNVMAQLIAKGEIKDLQEGRKKIKKDFSVKKFLPKA